MGRTKASYPAEDADMHSKRTGWECCFSTRLRLDDDWTSRYCLSISSVVLTRLISLVLLYQYNKVIENSFIRCWNLDATCTWWIWFCASRFTCRDVVLKPHFSLLFCQFGYVPARDGNINKFLMENVFTLLLLLLLLLLFWLSFSKTKLRF